jgi:hypothetical protein
MARRTCVAGLADGRQDAAFPLQFLRRHLLQLQVTEQRQRGG